MYGRIRRIHLVGIGGSGKSGLAEGPSNLGHPVSGSGGKGGGAGPKARVSRGGHLPPNFSAKSLWTHSVITAAIGKMLSDRLGMAVSDEAFLSGLMHAIGIMVEMQWDRARLIDVVQKVGADAQGIPANDMCQAEEQVLGANHQQFGAGLCAKWKFPNNFSMVTGFHHKPLEAPPESRTLPCLIYVADRLAAETGRGFRMDLATLDLDPAVLDALKLTTDELAALRAELPEALKSVESMLS